jgi:hypothetical protein
MGFTAKQPESTFEACPVGVHIARCFKLVDMGLQKKQYKGQPKGEQEKLMVGFELLGDERTKEGENFVYTQFYWKTLGENALLRAHLEAWRGKALTEEEAAGFDVSKLLGAYCQLNLVEDKTADKTYINIGSITPLHKSMPRPAPVNDITTFDMDDPDMTLFETFSDNMKEMLKNSRSWKGSRIAAPVSGGQALEEDAETPF